MTTNTSSNRSAIIQVDKALESWRDAGFDLSTASGEVVDNSIEAGAESIRIATFAAVTGGTKHVESIAFADDGTGIDPLILPSVLSLGFSTRYNQRNGMGRFGVGLKLAALSQARRVDIWTKPLGADKIYHTFIDLNLIVAGKQEFIEGEEVRAFPSKYKHLMVDQSDSTVLFNSGTLVVLSEVDRLVDGGRFGTSIDERLKDLVKFLGRAYRKFTDSGLRIDLNGRPITLHDPLFLLENPRVTKILGKDVRGEIIQEHDLYIDSQKVHVTVTIAPEVLRLRRGDGGSRQAGELYIPDNEGRISLVRQGREIYYDLIPRMFPSAIENPDRFIGVEVEFPATLDEYFQVRHVKRGAEPVDKLREELRAFLRNVIHTARKKIKALWDETETKEHDISGEHSKAVEEVSKVEQTAPRGRAGLNISPDDAEQLLSDLLGDLAVDPDSEEAQEIKQLIQEKPITIVDSAWAGRELFEILHLHGRATIKINHRHPFIREIYDPVKALAGKAPSDISASDVIRLARRIEIGLDVLFMAYAKAENMHHSPDDTYGELRSYWGMHAQSYVKEALKDS